MLGTDKADYATIGTADKFGGVEVGSTVGDSKVLFARIDEAKKMAEFDEIRKKQIEEAEREAKAKEKPEGCAIIGIEDFMNVELRTAQVLSCEPSSLQLAAFTMLHAPKE